MKKRAFRNYKEKPKNDEGFSWSAFFFFWWWYFYKGMIAKGIVLLIIDIILYFISPILMIGISVYTGFMGKKDLKKQVEKEKEEMRQEIEHEKAWKK